MITHRHPNTRGHLTADWIESYRTFSNNSYYDPNYINFSDLEVINDDRVQPGNCVPIHQHCDMEILGYVIDGPCYHNDNLQNVLHVPSGGVQRMSSGTGIWHVEGNLSDHPIHYLQIWMRPNKHNFSPSYEAYVFSREEKLNNFCPIASSDGPIVIQSDVKVSAGIFNGKCSVELSSSRRYYLYIVSGTATINDIPALTGSGFSFENEPMLDISVTDESEMILFNLR